MSTNVRASIDGEQAIITHIIRLSIFSRLTRSVKCRAISARRVPRGFVKLGQGAHDASSPSLQRRIDISGSLCRVNSEAAEAQRRNRETKENSMYVGGRDV